ncbi:hypothetical protein GCM10020001_005910 [Nonomuraea salmonea]
MFATEVRYSGISVAYAVGGTVAGALTPVYPALYAAGGSSTTVALFLCVPGLVSLLAVLGIRYATVRPEEKEPGAVAVPSES